MTQPERQMKRRTGHHWDVLLTGIITLFCGTFGLPWLSAPPVQCLAHVAAMSVMKTTDPTVVERVVEQRVTTIVTSLIICAFLN
jgi:hypothetical protein